MTLRFEDLKFNYTTDPETELVDVTIAHREGLQLDWDEVERVVLEATGVDISGYRTFRPADNKVFEEFAV